MIAWGELWKRQFKAKWRCFNLLLLVSWKPSTLKTIEKLSPSCKENWDSNLCNINRHLNWNGWVGPGVGEPILGNYQLKRSLNPIVVVPNPGDLLIISKPIIYRLVCLYISFWKFDNLEIRRKQPQPPDACVMDRNPFQSNSHLRGARSLIPWRMRLCQIGIIYHFILNVHFVIYPWLILQDNIKNCICFR